jgi:hypothetical protein
MPDKEPVRICLTVDTEGDAAENPHSTFLGIEHALPRLLEVFSRFGIKATFFVQEDRLCRVGSRFRDLWKSLENDGHEIGYHAHGLIRASSDEQAEIITSGLRTMRGLGFDPVSFRAGRYHFSGSLLGVLENNAIKYDSSVVPGLKEHFQDGMVRCDHLGAPHHPYFPSYEDHRSEGRSKILEMPVNRYPFLPARRSGVLKGTEPLEEVLFDYFYEIRKDKIIIVSVHTWDGLSAILTRLVRKERSGSLRKAWLDTLARIIGPRSLNNGSYSIRFEGFLDYAARKGDIGFATIKEAALSVTQREQRPAKP